MTYKVTDRMDGLGLLHPLAVGRFTALRDAMRDLHERGVMESLFAPFETYRTPLRQRQMLRDGVSKAGPWQSPHQFGLAVDFVPKVQGLWSWDEHLPYGILKEQAEACGLCVPISWDKCHVEVPGWRSIRSNFEFNLNNSFTIG